MYSHIYANLNRQTKGLQLLGALLEEEFDYLAERKIDEVAMLEFSIHELIRQLKVERDEIIKVMQGVKVSEYADMLPEEDKIALSELLESLDVAEQSCARQSSLNTELSLGLLDQSESLLDFLHSRALPPQIEVYGAKGGLHKSRPDAAVLSGRY